MQSGSGLDISDDSDLRRRVEQRIHLSCVPRRKVAHMWVCTDERFEGALGDRTVVVFASKVIQAQEHLGADGIVLERLLPVL